MIWPFRGTATGIHERSPQTTSVGHLGHGGVDDAISLQATITAAGAYCQRKRPSGLSTRCSRASSSSVSRGVVKREPSLSRASIASSASANETSARVSSARSPATADVELHRGIEQDGVDDPIGLTRRDLGDELAAEAVADPRGLRDPESVGRLEEIGDVLLDAPRRLPAGAAVAAVVDADHAVSLEALLGEAAKAPAVAGDAVQADDRLAPPDLPIP